MGRLLQRVLKKGLYGGLCLPTTGTNLCILVSEYNVQLVSQCVQVASGQSNQG